VSVAAVLARGRAAHLALMLEQGQFERAYEGTIDPATDQIVFAGSMTIYAGRFRSKPFRTGHDSVAGQVDVMKRSYDIELPWDATADAPDGPAIIRGDMFIAVVSDDLWLLGRHLTVVEVNYSATQTARHVMVQDLS
jgi:Family of unknown function (DUF6093)